MDGERGYLQVRSSGLKLHHDCISRRLITRGEVTVGAVMGNKRASLKRRKEDGECDYLEYSVHQCRSFGRLKYVKGLERSCHPS